MCVLWFSVEVSHDVTVDESGLDVQEGYRFAVHVGEVNVGTAVVDMSQNCQRDSSPCSQIPNISSLNPWYRSGISLPSAHENVCVTGPS